MYEIDRTTLSKVRGASFKFPHNFVSLAHPFIKSKMAIVFWMTRNRARGQNLRSLSLSACLGLIIIILLLLAQSHRLGTRPINTNKVSNPYRHFIGRALAEYSWDELSKSYGLKSCLPCPWRREDSPSQASVASFACSHRCSCAPQHSDAFHRRRSRTCKQSREGLPCDCSSSKGLCWSKGMG